MKFLSLLLCLAFSLHLKSMPVGTAFKGYTIVLKVTGVPNGTNFFLVKNGGVDTVAIARINHDIVQFKGNLEREGELHFIKIDTSKIRISPSRSSYVRLFLDNSKIQISGTLKEWPLVNITGSQATLSFEKLLSEIQIMRDSSQSKYSRIYNETTGPEKMHKANEEVNRHYGEIYAFFIKNIQSSAIPLLIYNYSPDSLEYIQSLYEMLPSYNKNSHYGMALHDEKIIRAKSLRNIKEGKKLPAFTITTLDGKDVSVYDFLARSEYTLIDFWASWCQPCRAQIPHLKAAYTKYKDVGFNILGISHDAKIEQWEKAGHLEQIPWTNTVDQTQKTVNIFALEGIPAYILVDKTGTIISFSAVSSIPNFGPPLRGEELNNTLKKLLSQ